MVTKICKVTIALFTKLSYIDRTELQERNRWQKMCWA